MNRKHAPEAYELVEINHTVNEEQTLAAVAELEKLRTNPEELFQGEKAGEEISRRISHIRRQLNRAYFAALNTKKELRWAIAQATNVDRSQFLIDELKRGALTPEEMHEYGDLCVEEHIAHQQQLQEMRTKVRPWTFFTRHPRVARVLRALKSLVN